MKSHSKNQLSLLSWAFVVPCIFIVFFVTWIVIQTLSQPTPLEQIVSEFRGFAIPDCKPDPKKLLGYLVVISLVPSLYFLYIHFISLQGKVLKTFAILGQGTLFLAVLTGWFYQQKTLRQYFRISELFILAILLAAFHFIFRRWISKLKLWFQIPLLSYSIAVTYCVIRLLPSIFTTKNILLTPETIRYHLEYTMGEFAAVFNGRAPLVDFQPQYQNLLEYLLFPIFHLFGMSIESFTICMSVLSLISLMLIFHVFFKITGEAHCKSQNRLTMNKKENWIAIPIFVSFVGISFYKINYFLGVPLSSFNYYAIGPLRYFGPFCVFFMLYLQLSSPKKLSTFLLFFIAGLSAINNIDFGAPALFAALIGSLANIKSFIHYDLRRKLNLLFSGLLGLMSSIGLFYLITWLHSEHLPSFSKFLEFRRIYAISGFCSYPLPISGFSWVVFLTFQAAIVTSIGRFVFHDAKKSDGHLEIKNGLLAFTGIFGVGAMSYYINRAHPEVLCTIFPAWGLCLSLFIWEGFLIWKNRKIQPLTRFDYFPLSLLAIGFLLTLAQGILISPLSQQIDRIISTEETYSQRQSALVQLIQSHSKPDEAVAILYPLGHLLAEMSQVNNIYPYAHHRSAVLVRQANEVIKKIEKNKIRVVFGIIESEIKDGIVRLGFQLKTSNEDFQVWERK